jgi:hypothetical protein
VTIDFGDAFAVDRIVVHPITDLWPEDFEILLSFDGENWISIDKQTGSQKPDAPYTVELSEPIVATMVKFEGTKLRSTAADGYMLQLAEIEAYGTPVCDKSILQSAMDAYVAAGGDVQAEAYLKAVAGMENDLLTSTSMDVLVRTLKANMPKPEETTEQETTVQTTEPSETQADSEPEQTEESEQSGGCKSSASMITCLLITVLGFACVFKKKKA